MALDRDDPAAGTWKRIQESLPSLERG